MSVSEIGRYQQQDVELLSEETLYQGFLGLKKLRFRHRLFAGGWSHPLERECLLRHQAVGVLLFDPHSDRLALVEQCRPGPILNGDPPWLLELVAGLIDTQEAVTEVARRESEEEAGCIVTALEPIARYYVSPGGSNEFFHAFCGCVDLSERQGGIFGLAEEHEDIRLHVLAFDQLESLLQQGAIRNAHTLIALQWLQLNRQRLRSNGFRP